VSSRFVRVSFAFAFARAMRPVVAMCGVERRLSSASIARGGGGGDLATLRVAPSAIEASERQRSAR